MLRTQLLKKTESPKEGQWYCFSTFSGCIKTLYSGYANRRTTSSNISVFMFNIFSYVTFSNDQDNVFHQDNVFSFISFLRKFGIF